MAVVKSWIEAAVNSRKLADPDTLYLHVQEPWLLAIQHREKIIEGRRGTAEKFQRYVNKVCYFYSERRIIPVMLQHVREYPTLNSFLDAEVLKDICPWCPEREYIRGEYLKIYPGTSIDDAGGMCALAIKVV